MTTMRVRYLERQVLRADDLNDEQGYRIALARRHNIGQHGWGIVYGLALEAEEVGFNVQPGVAVDGYGRELLVDHPLHVPWLRDTGPTGAEDGELDLFGWLGCELDDEKRAYVDVWLQYRRAPRVLWRPGRWACGPGQHNRWQETPRLCLTAAPIVLCNGRRVADEIDPRRPIFVTQGALDHGPEDDLPAGELKWPIYLGRLQRKPPSKGAGEHTYHVAPAAKAYVTLTGEQTSPPAGGAWMQVGAESPEGGQRFSVLLGQAEQTSDPAASPAPQRTTPQWAIDDPGGTELHAEVTCVRGLTLDYPAEGRGQEGDDRCTGAPQPPPTRAQHFVRRQRIALARRNWRARTAPADQGAAARRLSLPLSLPPGARRAPARANLLRASRLSVQSYGPAAQDEREPERKCSGSLVFDDPVPTPEAALPWKIYRTEVTQGESKIKQLRIEIGHPGDKADPAKSWLAIGRKVGDDFVASMTVQSDGTVIVHGGLEAYGQILEGPIRADPDDPRFAATLVEHDTGGLLQAGDLALSITGLPDEIAPNGTLTGKFKLENKGEAPITGARVYWAISLGYVPVQQAASEPPIAIAGGQYQEYPFQYTLPSAAAGEITIGASAVGIGQNNVTLSTSTFGRVSIT